MFYYAFPSRTWLFPAEGSFAVLKQMFNRYKKLANLWIFPSYYSMESLSPLTSVSNSTPDIDYCVASRWKDSGKEERLIRKYVRWQHTFNIFFCGRLQLVRNIGHSRVSTEQDEGFLVLFSCAHTDVIINNFSIMRPHRFWPIVCRKGPKQGGMCYNSLESRHDFKASRRWQIFH